MTTSPAAPYADLKRRMSRKIETRKAMQLKPDDLDMLVLSGAYATLSAYAVRFQEEQVRQRMTQDKPEDGPEGS